MAKKRSRKQAKTLVKEKRARIMTQASDIAQGVTQWIAFPLIGIVKGVVAGARAGYRQARK